MNEMVSLWENTEDSVNNMPNKYAKGIQFDTVNNILNTPKKTVNKFLTARMNPNLNGILSKEEGIKFENQQKQAIIDQDFQTFLQSLDQSKPENLKFLKEIKSYYKERGNYKKYTNAYEKYRDKLKKQKEMIKKNKEIKKMIPSFIDDLNNGKLIISETIPLKRSYLLNILETKKRINLWNSEHLSDEKSKLYNFIQEHPQRFLRMIKWFIPQDTEAIYNELEIYLYDAIAHKNDSWYSHVTNSEYNKNTLLQGIKLTAGKNISNITTDIKVTAFIYTDQDFDSDGNYNGNLKYSVLVKKSYCDI